MKVSCLFFAVGNSFARDWVNILMESEFCDRFEISYIYPYSDEYIRQRLSRFEEADYVFIINNRCLDLLPKDFDRDKIYYIGPKSFGTSNGIVYSRRFSENYFAARVRPAPGIIAKNRKLAAKYGTHYIDFMSCVMDDHGTVPVFSPAKKMISQDCRHLTQGGAQFYASILNIQRFAEKR